MGPNTEERMRAISAQQAKDAAQEAARLVYEQMYPVLVRIERRQGIARRIWNAIKHGWGVASKEIDETMKE